MMKKEMFKKVFYFLLIFLIGASLAFLSFFLYLENEKNLEKENTKNEILIENLKKEKLKKIENKRKETENILEREIQAKAFFVFDIDENKTLFAKNEKTKFPLASITKIMTALVALETPEKNIKINTRHLKTNFSSLKLNEIFSTRNLVTLMLITSYNEASLALAFGNFYQEKNRQNFIKKINNLAEKIGLESFFSFSDSGLDLNENISGSYANAEDVAKMALYFLKKYPLISSKTTNVETTIYSDKFTHQAKNTNKLLSKNINVLFSKTGFTKNAGGNLVMINKVGNKKIVTVILGSTRQGRFDNTEILIEKTKDFFLENLR